MNISKVRFGFLLLCLSLAACQAEASLAGRASVIDGDTIEIHGQRIRLHGIDAPESGQLCQQNGRNYRCGQRAALALSDLISNQVVRCEEKDIDRYRRIVAECYAGDTNLNAWLVENGWALAYREYTSVYVSYEDSARSNSVGMWQGEFQAPWDYRRANRAPRADATSAPSFNCAIKGNITSKGVRIYHVPGSRWYDNTSININRGERWFCNEDEARQAGWRAAQPN